MSKVTLFGLLKIGDTVIYAHEKEDEKQHIKDCFRPLILEEVEKLSKGDIIWTFYGKENLRGYQSQTINSISREIDRIGIGRIWYSIDCFNTRGGICFGWPMNGIFVPKNEELLKNVLEKVVDDGWNDIIIYQ